MTWAGGQLLGVHLATTELDPQTGCIVRRSLVWRSSRWAGPETGLSGLNPCRSDPEARHAVRRFIDADVLQARHRPRLTRIDDRDRADAAPMPGLPEVRD